jgi:hypothetical protein
MELLKPNCFEKTKAGGKSFFNFFLPQITDEPCYGTRAITYNVSRLCVVPTNYRKT